MFHRFELKYQQSWPNKKIFLAERCSPSSSSAAFRAKATSQILLKRLSPRTSIWSETFSATSLRCCSVQLTIDLNCCSELNWNWKLPGAPVQRARGSPVRDGDEDESRRRKVGFHWCRRLPNSCFVQPQVHLGSTTGTSRFNHRILFPLLNTDRFMKCVNYNSGLSQLWSKHCPLLCWGLRGSPGHQEHLQGDFLEIFCGEI